MGLQKWFIISKHAEEKLIRNNLKKLDVYLKHFGVFILDFNKISINDDEKWFQNVLYWSRISNGTNIFRKCL